MLIGRRLPGDAWDHYSFVEADMFDIGRRVTEYDRDARLVVNPETLELAVARWVPEYERITGGGWVVALMLPYRGEPDARVVEAMRESDASNKNVKYWRLRRRARKVAEDRARRLAAREFHKPYAERFVHAHHRVDEGWKPFAAIPRGI